MTMVFQRILEMSFQASFVIGAVIVIRLILKRMPRKYMCILWAAVLVRLLCPVVFSIELGFLSEIDAVWVQEQPPSLIDLGESVGTENALFEQWKKEEDALASLTESSKQEKAATGKVLMRFASLIWVSGVLVILLWNGVASFRLCGRIRKNGFQEERGLWSVKGLETPFVMGILRPQIYLPANLSKEERSFILIHEKTHIQRKDPLLKFIGFAALCVHWFNPLVWAAFYFMSADMEAACDERVLDRMGEGVREAYSATLLRLSAENPVFSGFASGFGEVDPKERIRHILNYRKPGMGRAVLLVSLLVLAAAAMLLSPRSENADKALAAGPGGQIEGTWAEAVKGEKKAEKAKEPEEGEVPQEIREAQKGIEAETHLEMVKFIDYAPRYTLSFQKIEGGTGERLSFEGNTEIADQKTTGPDNLEVEPEDAMLDMSFCFDGDENLADTVTFSFWNYGNAESFQVILDGLAYQFEVPELETKKIEIGKKLTGTQVVVEYAYLYPKALMLKLSGLDNTNWTNFFYLVRTVEGEEERFFPGGTCYEEETGEMPLLFTFEDGVPKENLTFRMGEYTETGRKEDMIHYNLELGKME